jgi:hypothetical protein
VQQGQAERLWASLTGVWERTAKNKGGWTQAEADALFGPVIPHTSKLIGSDEWRQMKNFVEANTIKTRGAPSGGSKKDLAAEQARLKLYDDLNKFAQANPGAFKDDKIPFGPNGADVPLHTRIPILKPEHFTKFSDLQRTLREGGTAAPKFQDFVSESQIVDGLASRYGIDPADKANAGAIRKLREVVQIAIQRQAPDGNLPFAEKQKIADEAVTSLTKAEPRWWSSKPSYEMPLLALDLPPHITEGFGRLVVDKHLDMDAATELAPLYAAEEPTIAAALDAVGAQGYDVTAAIDLFGWTQRNRRALDERLKAKGALTGDEARDAKLRYLTAIEIRKAR